VIPYYNYNVRLNPAVVVEFLPYPGEPRVRKDDFSRASTRGSPPYLTCGPNNDRGTDVPAYGCKTFV